MFFDQRQQAVQARILAVRQRSSVLRGQLAANTRVLHTPLAWVDRVQAGWRWLGAHPQWVAGGVATLVLLRPRRAWRLAGRGWALWRLWRRLQPWRATLQPLVTPLVTSLITPLVTALLAQLRR